MYNSKGKVFNIQRFSTSDGNGIRTVVFLKGCPLRCVWCHNPESQEKGTEIFYDNGKCIGCRSCEGVCDEKCHIFGNGGHIFKRENCASCGKCAEICVSNALEICGETKSVQEIIETVIKDKPFYDESGGGITLSGGEPLAQFDFALSILKSAKEKGIHTAIETCGFTNENIKIINEFTDLWLFDIKVLNEEKHLKYTGVSNKTILENLGVLDGMGANIILRCPIIPNVNLNKEHFEGLKKLALSLKNLKEIHLEPYHPLGISKSKQLGKAQRYNNTSFLESSKIIPFADELKKALEIPVIII